MISCFDPMTFMLGDALVSVGAGDVVAVQASTSGTIAYRAGTVPPDTFQYAWLDRRGREVEVISPALPTRPGTGYPNLSLDGTRLAVQISSERANVDIWTIDLRRGLAERLTSDPAIEAFPVWSPQGDRLVFNLGSDRSSVLREQSLGSETAQDLAQTTLPAFPLDWSRDGRFILFKTLQVGAVPSTDAFLESSTSDLWALPTFGQRQPQPVATSAFDERDGQFSPDARWVAFESNESGAMEIYLQPFPGPGRRVRVSPRGGREVRWRADGRELFFIAFDNSLMATAVRNENGTMTVDTPVALFQTALPGTFGIFRQQYGVSNDGQRFLMQRLPSSDSATVSMPIRLILDSTSP